jgi:predicted RNA-binding protein with PUA-like domain
MRYWLMKSEPEDVSIDDLMAQPRHAFEWTGVRNYQARNFMRNEMQPGDLALFWHSGVAEPGIAGLVEIVSTAHPDSSQYDATSQYFDPKSSPDKPRWWCVDVRLIRKTAYLSSKRLHELPGLETMQVLKRGNRLSITPVTEEEWQLLLPYLEYR